MAKRSFAVIGLGRFGAAMATTLAEFGQDVIGIDRNEDSVQAMGRLLAQAIQLDATDEKALRSAGVQDVDVAVVSIGENIEASLLVVVQVMALGVGEVIAKAVTPVHGAILEKLGVKRVIFPEREMGIRVAHSLALPSVIDYFELSRDCAVIELPAPAEWAGQSVAGLTLRKRYGVTLIAIRRTDPKTSRETTFVSPDPEEVIQAGDILAVLGDSERLGGLERLVAGQ